MYFFHRAMELLKECPLLKIEDVLPFFPDFVTIDHFKVEQMFFVKLQELFLDNCWVYSEPFKNF